MHPHVAALHNLARQRMQSLRGLPDGAGLGMLGPWAGKDVKLDADIYEITGTQVVLFADPKFVTSPVNPSTPGVVGFFNNDYGDNGGKIAGAPDRVDADAQIANIAGHKWAHVTTKTGSGRTTYGTNVSPGQTGWAPMDYMAIVGWTAAHGGTGPVPSGPTPTPLPTTPPEQKPPALMTGAAPASWTPWLLGGLALLGLGAVGYALFGTKTGKAGIRKTKAYRRLRRVRKFRHKK